jgi:benzoyl-CoA reductase/2-hydroxyglutaryl-CoA dehydratase subunit BcrC/BadD/HgdB
MTPEEVVALVAKGIGALINVIEEGTGHKVSSADVDAGLERYRTDRAAKEKLVDGLIAQKPDPKGGS